MKGLLERIEDKLIWYRNEGKNATISNVMDIRDRLAVDSYDLANIVSDSYSDFNGKYFIRQIQTSKKINSLVKAKTPVNKATHIAKEELETIYKTELESESVSHRLGLLLKQVNKVLDAMNQRIGHLRKLNEEDSK